MDSSSKNCQLMGSVGVLIQIMLAILCFLALILKRYYTVKPRPWSIWILVNNKKDTSKIAALALLQHFLNLVISFILEVELSSNDECIWYFYNILIDTTIGCLFCYILHYIVQLIARKFIWNVFII